MAPSRRQKNTRNSETKERYMVTKTPLSPSTTAFWNGMLVDIHGGFRSATLGHRFEISSPSHGISRQNVSVWDLAYHSEESAQAILRHHFEYLGNKEPIKAITASDRRKGLAQELVVKIHDKVIDINQLEAAVEAA